MGVTKRKGDKAQLIIAAQVLRDGYQVALPYGEDWRFDLIVLKRNRLLRVQAKYVESHGERIEVRCRSCNGWSVTRYRPSDIDWIIVFDRDTNRCYYVPAKMLGADGRNSITLRIAPPKNRQRKGVLYARDFERW